MRLPDHTSKIDEITDLLDRGERVVISGPEGSGRTLLARQLEARVPGARLLEFPLLDDVDAPAAVLLLASSLFAAEDRPSALVDTAGAPTAELREACASYDAPVIIRLSGTVKSGPSNDPDEDHRRHRLHKALEVLRAIRRAVWVVDRSAPAFEFRVDSGLPSRHTELPQHSTHFPEGGWGDLEPTADMLKRRLPEAAQQLPVVWRLAVGAVHLGVPPPQVISWCERPTPEALASLSHLVSIYLRNKPPLAQAVRQLLLIRFPMAREVLLQYLAAPPEMETLFTHCLGYGEPVRVNPTVRSALLRKLGRGGRAEEHHYKLARTYKQLDGVSDPAGLAPDVMTAWVEKVHHLSHAGPAGEAEWSAQTKATPDLYWERARFYSIKKKNFALAASIYKECIERFPEDDYGHHYFAFNVSKSGGRAATVLWHYQKSVEICPRNPWWNSRNITSLIECGRWIEAKRAWVNAMRALDPDGGRSSSDPWLVAHFHYWVANAWVAAGLWYEARAVVNTVPNELWRIVDQAPDPDRRVGTLRRHIRDAQAEERTAFEKWLAERNGDPQWSRVKSLMDGIISALRDIPMPALGYGEDGPTITWSHPGVIFQIEFATSAGLAWAGRDRIEGRSESAESDDDSLDEAAWIWLHRVRST